MRQYQTYINASITRHDNDENTCSKGLLSDEIDRTVVINPLESTIENTNHPSIHSDEDTESSIPNNDDNDSLTQCQLNHKTSFDLSNIKPIKILFSSLNEQNKRKSEDLPRKYSNHKVTKNFSSVSHNMKYTDQLSNSNNILRTASIESSSDECPRKIYNHSLEQQISSQIEKLPK